MIQETSGDFAARLAGLERENRRLKQWALTAVLGGMLTLLGGATSQERNQKSIESEQFVLRDKQGRMRARLDAHLDDPVLTLIDRGGRSRLALALEPDGRPAVELSDSMGHLRLALRIGEAGEAGLEIYDQDETPRGILQADATGVADMRLLDDTGKDRIVLSQNGKRGPMVVLNDAGEHGRIALKLDEARTAVVQLSSDKPPATGGYVGLSMTAEGGADLTMVSPQVDASINLGVNVNDGAVISVDDAGKSRAGIGVRMDGYSYVNAIGREASHWIEMKTAKDGMVGLDVVGGKEQTSIALRVPPNDEGTLRFVGARNLEQIALNSCSQQGKCFSRQSGRPNVLPL